MKTSESSPPNAQQCCFLSSRARTAVLLLAVSGVCLLLLCCTAPAGPKHPRASMVSARLAAITFDDLPVISVTEIDAAARREITRKLLHSIRAYGIPATGFVNEYGLYGYKREVTGEPDQNGIELLQMWLNAGLELGNHAFAHTDLHATSRPVFEADVIRGEAVTGKLMQQQGLRLRFFRYPYLHTGRDLVTKQAVERFLTGRGYRLAPATILPEDYLFAAAYSRAAERGDETLMRRVVEAYLVYTEAIWHYSETLSRTLFGREIHQVVLLHANALNADVFDKLAAMMQRRGYTFISLDAALRDTAYSSADTYTGEASINWLERWGLTRGVEMAEIGDALLSVPEFVLRAADVH